MSIIGTSMNELWLCFEMPANNKSKTLNMDKSEALAITSSTENAQPSTSSTENNAQPSTSRTQEEPEPSCSEDLDFENLADFNTCLSSLSISNAQEEEEEQEVIDETTVQVPPRTLPSCNVPEKIVIVFDRASDEDDCTSFEVSYGKKYPTTFMMSRSLKMFLYNKNAINSKHQFALVFLNEHTASWVQDFTSSPAEVIAALENVETCKPEDIFDLNTVFDLIQEKVVVCTEEEDKHHIPPPYVVRIVFMYARSYSLPNLRLTKEVQALLNSPYFTFDVLMTHDPPSSANHCKTIFKKLQEIDKKGFNYSFSVSRNASDLHVSMAKLLSHPLQRPHQKYANYNINTIVIN